jgi:archaellum component FlaF (FlaF/FlaG flagellin family)
MTLLLAIVLGTIVPGLTSLDDPEPLTIIEVRTDASTNTITLVNKGPRDIDVRELTITIEIDGTPLEYPLTIPYFSQRGFHPGPTGAFNSATDPYWLPGERVSFRIASTNTPTLTPGDSLTITLKINNSPIAQRQATIT